MVRILLTLFLISLGSIAAAVCNDDSDLSPADLARLRAEAALMPFHKGNLWQVEKDGVISYVFGTMHIYDPRHEAAMERLKPLIATVEQVLVEADKDSEAQLNSLLMSDPNRYLITSGPSLLDRLGAEAWAKLKPQLESYGMPPFMAAKFQPWFLGFTMMVPPCAMEDLRAGRTGIDKSIEAYARETSKPVASLDDMEWLLNYFAKDPLDQQVEEMRWGLMLDVPMTPPEGGLGQFYFEGEHALIWGQTYHQLAKVTGHLPQEDQAKLKAMVDEMLIDLIPGRNLQWMDQLLPTLERTPSLVAVGALHLSGEQGVLNELQKAGFTVTALSMSHP